MTRFRKICIAICVLALVIAGLYLYWETEIPLTNMLPDEDWTKVQLFVGDPGVGESEWEGALAPEDILAAVNQTKVTRGPEFSGMSQPYFHLYLIHENGYPTTITAVENGQVAVAIEMDFDNYRYYEGGEELYQALLALTSE